MKNEVSGDLVSRVIGTAGKGRSGTRRVTVEYDPLTPGPSPASGEGCNWCDCALPTTAQNKSTRVESGRIHRRFCDRGDKPRGSFPTLRHPSRCPLLATASPERPQGE